MKLSLVSDSLWNGLEEIRVDRYPCVLGRDSDSDYPVRLAFVSRRHCRLWSRTARFSFTIWNPSMAHS
jgi:hypothetical protein